MILLEVLSYVFLWLLPWLVLLIAIWHIEVDQRIELTVFRLNQ
jgi:hypothetical protein